MHKLNITSVRDAVQAELLEGAGKELLQYLFAQGATICVFAGAVRDTVFAHEVGLRNISPRDWDIGISGIPVKSLMEFLRNLVVRKINMVVSGYFPILSDLGRYGAKKTQ